ncbi:hypothetical protein Bca101_038615 [Brassica carinata]
MSGGACWWSAVKAPVCVLLSTLKLFDFIVYHITKESINDDFRWHNSSEAPTVTVKTSLHCISPARASMMASDGTTPPTVMYDNSSPKKERKEEKYNNKTNLVILDQSGAARLA